MKRVLFVCSQNRLRSPTAEQIFAARDDIEVDSAGTNVDATQPLSRELIEWPVSCPIIPDRNVP